MIRLDDDEYFGYSETMSYTKGKKFERLDGYWVCKAVSKTRFNQIICIAKGDVYESSGWIRDRISIGGNEESLRLLKKYPNELLLLNGDYGKHKLLKRYTVGGELIKNISGIGDLR